MAASSPASTAPSTPEDLSRRLAGIRARMTAAAGAVGRDPASVTLTAVSKTQPPEAIEAALAAGLRVFGENRVQEAQGRWTEFRPRLPDLELRLIGPLQSNKAVDAVALFDVIETLDREKLVGALAAAQDKVGRRPRVLVQVNTGEEEQKAGVAPRDADALIASARAAGLDVQGLMAIPPADEEPVLHFALLAKIAARNDLRVLSMGMSGDYEAAIRLGATHVRVGSALFGERKADPALF
ncbi:YggS family pyridoxal phosphate-dependent enzyme [Brevundimonas aurifodinae]|uniref:Pyridoxal phosphate homeostasis protein n=2 Tax=Brevundimonas TaxID=41275 RepID=A0ABV1NIH4_9CAUL|nr:MAG: YggS family pyridoxal phosphate enzyme [Brevundimonas sp. 12-68-7]OYX35718.1 MAG: YggS family pyridoxal phosphate enzyme [Brevundimonas subvibrioides]